jgi:hypothetical protein
MIFAHGGFINTGIFQFLVIVVVGIFLLPATFLLFFVDWNLMDAFQDAFYSGWWWFFSLCFWAGLSICENSGRLKHWWNERIE